MERKTREAQTQAAPLPAQVSPVDRTLAASARLAADAGVVASQNAQIVNKFQCDIE